MSNVLLTLAILKWLQLDKLIPYTFFVHFSETKPSCAGARFDDTPICSCFVHICVPFQQVPFQIVVLSSAKTATVQCVASNKRVVCTTHSSPISVVASHLKFVTQ